MCRLCAITATDFGDASIPTSFKAQLVHECMMRSAHDELGQKDGWGVTDGHKIWASTNWYLESAPHWLPSIRQDGIIISHLRKASGGTGRTLQENHPYRFTIGAERLYAAHNGFFAGTNWEHWNTGDPATDSWRALNDLALLMTERHTDEIDASLVNDWLSKYEVGSHYAVLLWWRNRLYAIRGRTRTLAALPIGNGYLLHTNIDVLHIMRRYVAALYEVETREPVIIKDDRLVRFEMGNPEVIVSELHPTHKAVYTQRATWQESNYPKTTAAIVVRPASDVRESAEEPSNGYTVAASVLPRRSRTVETIAATNDFPLAERRKQWSVLAGKLSPLRRDLSLMWVSSMLGYTDPTRSEYPMPQLFLTTASRKEFELAERVLLPINVEGKYEKPFSPMANLMLNWWSHIVKPGYDADLHFTLFGLRFFWLDRYYTTMAQNTDSDTVQAMRVWQTYMVRMFSQLTKGQAEKWLDMRVFKSAVKDVFANDTVWYNNAVNEKDV
jgi:hypothetical protein